MIFLRHTTILFLVFYVAIHSLTLNEDTAALENEDDRTRVYGFNKVNGGACPYTASWLAHVNLYRRVTWYLESMRMEAASFRIFDTSRLKFQLADPDAYYVHHMSMYEHLLHRKFGYEVAQNRTLVLSQSALEGECSNLKIRPSKEYLALIPFFGGRPPEVSTDLKVKSLGQGNSLVSAETKSLQCIATLCSCLKYYGHAVIGVVRDEDKKIIIDALDQMHPSIKANTHIVQLKVTKNAHLPHHLLAWGQQFIKDFNCGLLSPKDGKVAPSTAPKVSSKGTAVSDEDQEELTASHDLMQICGAKGIAEPVGAPVQVLYHRPSLIHSRNESTSSKAEKGGTFSKYMPSKVPIKFVYYTECDQIVYYDSQNTLVAMSSASNDSTFFVGRRKEKSIDSEAAQYMAGLSMWRECGEAGFSMLWPKDNKVRVGN